MRTPIIRKSEDPVFITKGSPSIAYGINYKFDIPKMMFLQVHDGENTAAVNISVEDILTLVDSILDMIEGTK